MCGIAGLCGFHGDYQQNIEKMNRRMYHRGPDAGGFFAEEDGSVALGHRRLSIIDLTETGTQPMHSRSGRYVIVFNGEIYNHRTIRAEFSEDIFRGTSDTEVLLASIEKCGIKETLKKCKGMFAIALWDREEKTLTLARDRVGEKPLYYGHTAGCFAFASDIGCLTQIDGFHEEINREILPFYFTHGYIPAPYSIYQNVYKLEPGCMLTISAPFEKTENYKIESYWSMNGAAKKGFANPFSGTSEEAADELERLLKASIADQMVADVPVGAFLSAGIDSSTCVALMQSLDRGQVRSFTIGMEEDAYNEADAAELIAKHLGTKHTRLTINEKDAKDVIPSLAYMYGEPFADSSQIPTYLVSKLTREHVTVALSGDGGDELFGGYNIYGWSQYYHQKMKGLPTGARKAAGAVIDALPIDKESGLSMKAQLLKAESVFDVYMTNYTRSDLTLSLIKETQGFNKKEALQKIRSLYGSSAMCRRTKDKTGGVITGDLLEGAKPDNAIQSLMLQDMCLYHPEDILVKVDRAGMAVSLESRIPMLDKDVVEFAWSIPMKYKRQGDLGKLVLRDVLYRHVPKELMDRPKKGFSIPIKNWLLEPDLRAWAEELLSPAKIEAEGILNSKAVKRIWEDYTERGIWRAEIWYLLMFEQWLSKEFVNN